MPIVSSWTQKKLNENMLKDSFALGPPWAYFCSWRKTRNHSFCIKIIIPMGTLGFTMLGHLASFRSLESTAVMFMQTLKGNTKLASRLNSGRGQGLGDGG